MIDELPPWGLSKLEISLAKTLTYERMVLTSSDSCLGCLRQSQRRMHLFSFVRQLSLQSERGLACLQRPYGSNCFHLELTHDHFYLNSSFLLQFSPCDPLENSIALVRY